MPVMPRCLFALIAFATVARLAAQHCVDPGVQVTHEQRGNTVHLFAQASHCLEATVTVTAELTNMTSSRPLPATFEVRGPQRIELGTLRPAGTGRWAYRYQYRWMNGARGGKPDGSTYRLPFAAGGRHRLIQGHRGAFSHQAGTINEHALDWSMPEGTPVLAARDGVVVSVRQDSDHGGGNANFKQCGNYVAIRHADGTYAEYLHLQVNSARVRLGDTVRTGQLLARSGNTGFTTTPHLHFVVFRTTDGQNRETLPVTFQTASGENIALVQGRTY